MAQPKKDKRPTQSQATKYGHSTKGRSSAVKAIATVVQSHSLVAAKTDRVLEEVSQMSRIKQQTAQMSKDLQALAAEQKSIRAELKLRLGGEAIATEFARLYEELQSLQAITERDTKLLLDASSKLDVLMGKSAQVDVTGYDKPRSTSSISVPQIAGITVALSSVGILFWAL